MKSGRALRRKKTNLAQELANATTLYAPAVYPVPYGAVAVRVGGQGSPGNVPSGGTVLQQGFYTPATFTPGNLVPSYLNTAYYYYNDDQHGGNSYTDYVSDLYGVHAYSNRDNPWGPSPAYSYYIPSPFNYTANVIAGDPGAAGYSQVTFNVDYYRPGNREYMPEYYNSSYYNPGTRTPAKTNPTYYNPYVPGTASTGANVAGVSLPGAPASTQAPVVAPTMSTMKYATAGVSVTVPPGGYVVLTPIG